MLAIDSVQLKCYFFNLSVSLSEHIEKSVSQPDLIQTPVDSNHLGGFCQV